MCLSEIGRVVAVDAPGHSALVDTGERVVPVSTVTLGLDGPHPAVGDWLVIHTGFAVERLDDEAAADVLRARREYLPDVLDSEERR